MSVGEEPFREEALPSINHSILSASASGWQEPGAPPQHSSPSPLFHPHTSGTGIPHKYNRKLLSKINEYNEKFVKNILMILVFREIFVSPKIFTKICVRRKQIR
jgi:hypothetical protein